MLPAEFEPEAAVELEEAWQWYEQREPGLGDELVRSVKAVVARAQREPEYYPPVLRDARRGVVRRFPYGVIYAVREGRLVVFAVFHSSRDPGGWLERVTGR